MHLVIDLLSESVRKSFTKYAVKLDIGYSNYSYQSHDPFGVYSDQIFSREEGFLWICTVDFQRTE